MQGKIALEEHFALEDTLGDSQRFAPASDWPELKARLLDIQERRLREIETITGPELNNFVKQYLIDTNLTVGWLEPPAASANGAE